MVIEHYQKTLYLHHLWDILDKDLYTVHGMHDKWPDGYNSINSLIKGIY